MKATLNRRIQPLSVALLALLISLTGTANAVAAPQSLMRIESTATNKATLVRLQTRLQVQNTTSQTAYQAAKVQAWLAMANDMIAQRDWSGATEQALAEAATLLNQLEIPSGDLPTHTAIIPASQKLRDDLWQQAEQFKAKGEFKCAAAQTAELEVQLVAAGVANKELGWRHAKPYLQAAERLAASAQEQIVVCSAQAKPSSTSREVAPGNVAAEKIPTSGEKIEFAANSSAIDDANALVLEKISYGLRANRQLKVELRSEYNMSQGVVAKLAQARAEAVHDYLAETGVGKERITIIAPTAAMGSSVQVITITPSPAASNSGINTSTIFDTTARGASR